MAEDDVIHMCHGDEAGGHEEDEEEGEQPAAKRNRAGVRKEANLAYFDSAAAREEMRKTFPDLSRCSHYRCVQAGGFHNNVVCKYQPWRRYLQPAPAASAPQRNAYTQPTRTTRTRPAWQVQPQQASMLTRQQQQQYQLQPQFQQQLQLAALAGFGSVGAQPPAAAPSMVVLAQVVNQFTINGGAFYNGSGDTAGQRGSAPR